jgi:hypothetical protein
MASWQWAAAWKAAAKRWRRRALETEAALADRERGEWLRVQQPVEYEVAEPFRRGEGGR